MKTNKPSSPSFLAAIVALLLLAAVATTPSAPTLAGPPEPGIPQPEPFHIRLDKPLSGANSGAKTVSASQIGVAADPGEWYDLIATQNFDGGTFPPENWSVEPDSGSGWAKQDAQHLSGSYSAGVVTTTTGILNTQMVYGGETGISLQGTANAELKFSYWLNTDPSGDDPVYFGWAASADGQNFYGARISGSVSKWLTGTLDLGQYIDEGAVWVAFFVNGTNTGAQEVYVDDVSVQGMEPYRVYLPASLKNYATTFTFSDDFSDTGSGWPHILEWGSTKEERGYITGYIDKFIADYPNDYSIVGGACREHPHTYFMRNGEWAQRIIAKPGLTVGSQFVMEVDITYCDDALFASTGLVFGLNSDNSQYYRVILIYDPGGGGTMKYAIWRDSTVLVSTSPSAYLNGGFSTNRVKVVRNGCNISVYFNDHLEWSTSGECSYTGDDREVGLFHDRYPGHGNTGAVLDNFRLEGALQASGSGQQVAVWTTESWPLERSLPNVQYIEWRGSDEAK